LIQAALIVAQLRDGRLQVLESLVGCCRLRGLRRCCLLGGLCLRGLRGLLLRSGLLALLR
jgi:hypothetical protein